MANATIRDVARHADVSVASVSRVINGIGGVSDMVRDRVNGAIEALGYVPHAGARSLSLSRTNAIGVILPALHGEFFSEFVRGLDLEAAKHGYLLLLSNLGSGNRQTKTVLNAMLGRVDGLVMMAPQLGRDEVAAALPKAMPTVLINSHAPGDVAGSIHIGNAQGVDAAIEHLFANGRRRIVHIAGPQNNMDAEERREAYLAAAARLGFEPLVLTGDFFIESGGTAVHELLSRDIAFDAIFAANDNMAIGAFEALVAAGRTVPGDVAIVGFDDIPLASHTGLSTIRVRIADIGQRAIAKLVEALHGKALMDDEYDTPELIIRATSGPDGSGAQA